MTLYDFTSLGLGMVGICLAIYQTAVVNERRGVDRKLQFLLAGISTSLNMKQVGWNLQIQGLLQNQSSAESELVRVHLRARDDIAELQQLVASLEGAISYEFSAISHNMKKAVEQAKLNTEFQDLMNSSKGSSFGPNSADINHPS